MRAWSMITVLVLGCGGGAPPSSSSAPSSHEAPSSEAASTEAPSSAAPSGAVLEAEAPSPPPTSERTAPAVESCEGLARWCGGWTGCVHVRERRDADGTLHFDGLDDVAGRTFAPDARCAAGELCNDMCDPSTATCRPGVLEEIRERCTRSTGPSRAPFFCELIDGACVQHDLPPAAVHAGGRS